MDRHLLLDLVLLDRDVFCEQPPNGFSVAVLVENARALGVAVEFKVGRMGICSRIHSVCKLVNNFPKKTHNTSCCPRLG